MKPAIAYGLTGSSRSSDWLVLAITSQNRQRVYGREERGRVTSVAPRDVHGRFATLDEAKIAQQSVREVYEGHRAAIEAAKAELRRLTIDRDAAVRHALENIRVSKVAA